MPFMDVIYRASLLLLIIYFDMFGYIKNKIISQNSLSHRYCNGPSVFTCHPKLCTIMMGKFTFYNDKRPHQINRYRTPNATEDAYYKRHSDDISETI